MKKSYNDSGLTAKRSDRLLAAVLIAAAVSLASCQTTTVIPIDDVYYWDKHEQAVLTIPATEAAPTGQTTPTTQTAPDDSKDIKVQTSKPSIEVISQKDTTITVRIKK
jgi:hypothetical protein